MPPELSVITMDDKTNPPSPGDGAKAPRSGGRGQKKEERAIDWGRYNALQADYVLIYGTDTVYDVRARMIMKVNALRLAFGSDMVKMWLNSETRRMVRPDQLVFDPSDAVDPPCINLFGGFGCVPKEGDCGPILELLYHLCSESAATPSEVARVVDWQMKWLALPLQRPGTKMRTALVYHGAQGAGKNLFFEIMVAIYGKCGLVVGQDQLEDKFNDWASQKCFLIGDEVVAKQELYHQKNKLKAFITGETIQINTKMLPLRTERNHVNVVFLSNELQPLALEDGDRRYFVIYTPPRRQDDLYKRVAACLRNGGYAAFLHHLLEYPIEDFNEFTLPLMTQAKQDLINLGLKPAERFMMEWLGGYLPLPLTVCSASQAYRAFKRWCGQTGERWPPPQEIFTKTAKKCVEQLEHRRSARLMDYKVVKLDDETNGKRSERVWIPVGCGAPEGYTEGRWAAMCVSDFDEKLGKFMVEAAAQ